MCHKTRSLQDPMTSSRNQTSGFLLGFPQQLRWAWKVVQGEQDSPELVCPGRTSPRWSQVGSVAPDPHTERDARIPPLLRVVPRYKAASPPSQSSHETNWREGTVQWGAGSSPLDTELVSLHPPPHLFIYGPSLQRSFTLMDGVCTCSSYPEHGALQPLLYLL